MTTIRTIPPTTITAGDSVAFTWTHSDYPASASWALTYALAGINTATVSGVANADGFDVTLTAAQTAVLRPGAYRWSLRVTKTTTTTTVGVGRCEVRGNVTAAGDGEFAIWAEQTLSMLEASIQGDVTDAVAQWMIGDRQMTKIPMHERLKLRNQLRAEVQMAKSSSGFGAPVYMTPRAVT